MDSFVITADQESRYDRHHLIDWWDQNRLKASRVLVAGAGALGNEVLKNLALLGIGNITVIDFDTVSITNLTRSVLFRESDVGLPKVEVARQRALEINPEIAIQAIHGDLEFDLGIGDVREHDVIIGCLDSVNARWAINQLAYRAGVPWINGGIGVAELKKFCIRLNPNYANAYHNRGNAYYALSNNQAAIEDYNQAIRLNPNFANAYNNRGNAQSVLGNNQAAINDYNQAIRLKPNYTEAKTNLDIACSKLEKIQKPKVSHSRNSETNTITEVNEEYIDVLNLGAIHRKIDQIVTVKGRVASVNVDKSNNIIYFNFGENTYQGFYAYVPTTSGHKFPHPTKYSGKTVIISGKISLNRNMRPRMALNNSSQLKDAEQ